MPFFFINATHIPYIYVPPNKYSVRQKQTVNCGVGVIINQACSGSKLVTATIGADDIMLQNTQMFHGESNVDYINIYNLSVVLLELPVSDVFLKVHVYLRRVLCISACLCCGALAYMYLHVKI